MSHIIPPILHQVWLGDQKRRPQALMDSCRSRLPAHWEYILWTEDEVRARALPLQCERQMRDIAEVNGKADILRWEALFHLGGVALDADTYCIEPLDDTLFLKPRAGWACYENEVVRPGLVACGAMGFPPRSPIVGEILRRIAQQNLHPSQCSLRAWQTVACALFTQVLATPVAEEFVRYPSFFFYPQHFSGIDLYRGHGRVFAYQAWANTYSTYGEADAAVRVPREVALPPPEWISVLIPHRNVHPEYTTAAFESIMKQNGHFGIELVVVDDASDADCLRRLRQMLTALQGLSRFTRVVLCTLSEHTGVAGALNAGLLQCSCDLVARMDADDIMTDDRLEKQLAFMAAHPDCPVVGAQMLCFTQKDPRNAESRRFFRHTNHPRECSWTDWQRCKPVWFMNHPTLVWRRTALQQLGGYPTATTTEGIEDFAIELKAMRQFSMLRNMPDTLLYYRLHREQVTYGAEKDLSLMRRKFSLIQQYLPTTHFVELERDPQGVLAGAREANWMPPNYCHYSGGDDDATTPPGDKHP